MGIGVAFSALTGGIQLPTPVSSTSAKPVWLIAPVARSTMYSTALPVTDTPSPSSAGSLSSATVTSTSVEW